ncbi:TPA: PGF-pre-PGF domain-containing protein [Methanosarcina acetivorans]|nr:CARDB domain-containing protein [Methanosarcina acetivorans]HIH95594.1 PGF-pre-PGF domain-containing protein [Methanosarcina acetivorans]
MKVSYFHSLINVLIITLLIPGVMLAVAAAAEDIPSGDDGNSTVLLPDLVIENDFSWSPTTPEVGEEVTITATVKNQGDAASGATTLALYIDGSSVREWDVSELSSGESSSVSYTWIPGSEGSVELRAVVDEDNLITESNEGNNEETATVTVAENSLPDLIISTFSYPEEPESGEQQRIQISVKNEGTAASSRATTLALYIDGSSVREWDVPRLSSGKSSSVSYTWVPESEGSVELRAVVDEDNLITESNEGNNEETATVTVTENSLPDLIISTFSYPEDPEPGEHQRIRVNVKNQGTATSEATMLVLYIDGDLVENWAISRLSSGEISYNSYTWIPTSEGTVELKAVVDKDNLVAESNEENNEKTATVAVAEDFFPDLIIEDLVPESEGEVGKTLNLTLKVKNQGTAPSEGVQAEYYINGTAPTQDDIQVPALSVGEEKDVMFSLVPDREGQMEVKVHIDSGTDVYELDENNNEFTKIVDVKTIRPDLIIESLSLNPASPKVGDDITFTVSIKNKGLRDSGSSELKYYINGTNLTQEGKISIPEIAMGETTTGIFHWVPEAEGSVDVRLVADSGNTILEEDETDNELTKTVSVAEETTSNNEENSDSSSGGGGSSGSSSSSSMGSGVSKEPAKNVEVKELDTRHIMSGYPVKYDFAENATCVTYLEVSPLKTYKKTTATVEVLKGKSIFVQKLPPGRVYKQLNIWLGNKGAGNEDSIKSAYTGFKVEKDWIENNSVNESNVTLLWYDSKWMPLSTEKTGEDEDYVYFRAKTIAFSCFAISEYTGEEGTVETGEGIQETLRGWEDGKAILNSSAEKEEGDTKNPMGVAKVLLAISLPLFMILVEYFVLKKKI